jgi:uncharacterized protein
MLRWLTALLGWLAVAIAPAAEGLAPIPPLTARVTDLTGTLDATQRAQLENRLAALEREKGAQLVIVLVPSVQPESIEAYGIRLAEAWRIGRQGVDDGVIILVAKNDRAVRIEVGYGLEGAIPDALAKRIIEERIVPRFREGDFYGGLSAGVDALARLIRGETLLPPAKRTAPEPQKREGLFIFLFLVGGLLLTRLLGLLGALLTGAFAGCYLWWLGSPWIMALLAAFFIFGIYSLWYDWLKSGSGRHASGGFFSSGGYSGGGFSGGGFSGGGGGFGGGGASGRW